MSSCTTSAPQPSRNAAPTIGEAEAATRRASGAGCSAEDAEGEARATPRGPARPMASFAPGPEGAQELGAEIPGQEVEPRCCATRPGLPPARTRRPRVNAQAEGRGRSGGVGSAAGRPGLVAMSWREWARCKGVDPEIFYPPEDDEARRGARRSARSCPVREVCLEHAHRGARRSACGAAMTERERRRMLRQRRKAS